MTASPVSARRVKSGAGSPSTTISPSLRRAVGIVRVSCLAGEDPVSPGEQRQRIEAHCEGEALDLVDTLEEADISGGAPLEKRPGLYPAVLMVEAGKVDVIVAAYATYSTTPARLHEFTQGGTLAANYTKL